MRIAIGKKSDLGLRFEVDIPGFAPFPIDLVRNANTGQNQPAWHAQYRSERCGAFWKKIAKESGEEFLSGQLESPAFPGGRIDVAIFNSQEKGCKDMTWRYRPAEERTATAPKPSASTPSATAERGSEEDDDIPF